MKVYQKGECDEYDAKARMVPFKGLLLDDIPSDSEGFDEEQGISAGHLMVMGVDREAFYPH